MKREQTTKRIVAIALLCIAVILIGVGIYGLVSRSAQNTTDFLDTMRLRALLVNTGEGATDAMVEVAKKEAQAKAKEDGLSMEARRAAAEEAEAKVRANAANLSVDYSTVDEAPIREAAIELQDAQVAYADLHIVELEKYEEALKEQQATKVDDTVTDQTVDVEDAGMDEAAMEEPELDLSGFEDTPELSALWEKVDKAYEALCATLVTVYPDLDQDTLTKLKGTLLDLNFTEGDTFESRYDRLSPYNDGNISLRMQIIRSGRNLVLLGIFLLLMGLIVLYYQQITKALGMPRLIIGMFFVILCLSALALNLNLSTLLSDTLVRMGMNSVLVLAMVPGIQCGISLNLGLPLGIIGGLIGGLLCIEVGLTGWTGFFFAIAVAILIAAVLGFLYAQLLNRLKGSEMSVTTYVGFSIVSLMCITWLIIPFRSPVMRWPMGKGLRMTINMVASYRHILNDFLSFEIFGVTVPTGLLLFMLFTCALVWLFSQTKTGIAMQAVGNNPRFAEASGISVDKMRVIGTTLSTILGAVGIIVYSQSYGFMQLYTAPRQMGFIAASAILIGGASTSRAKISHVLIGTFLFQGVLTLGMPVANKLVPQSTISETLRILISNGIILYALTKSGGNNNA